MYKMKNYYLCSSLANKYLKKTLNRIIKAINEREKIVIYGYHDLDSISGISLLILILRYLNADVEYYIPDSMDLSYDLMKDDIDNYIKYLGAKVILTVGCGINSIDEIKRCNDIGIDVIITDYHAIKYDIPNTYIVTNDEEEVKYYNNNLSAVCVAFKLASIIAEYYQINCVEKYLDLVLIGILSKNISMDMYIKTDIIKKCIKQLEKTNNYGILALKKIHNIKKIDNKNIFKLISTIKPTVNPIGKMDDAKIIVELLTTSNKNRAEQISKYLKTQMENKKCMSNSSEILKIRNFTKHLQIF